MGAMKVLLDTHAYLWWLFDDSRLSATAREIVGNPDNEVFVSAATAWEIATKVRIGRLPSAEVLARDFSGWIARANFLELPIQVRHAQHAGAWPQAHRDPFDRMLAAQSQLEDLPLISTDPLMETFGIAVIW